MLFTMSETENLVLTNCSKSPEDSDSILPPSFLRQQFLESVAAAGKVSLPELTSRSSKRLYARIRWAGMLYLRDTRSWSLPRIAALFDRDHTTVKHGLTHGRALMESDACFRAMFERVACDD